MRRNLSTDRHPPVNQKRQWETFDAAFISQRPARVTPPSRPLRRGLPEQRCNGGDRNDAPLETIGVHGEAVP